MKSEISGAGHKLKLAQSPTIARSCLVLVAHSLILVLVDPAHSSHHMIDIKSSHNNIIIRLMEIAIATGRQDDEAAKIRHER
jgi:hypothetical protein